MNLVRSLFSVAISAVLLLGSSGLHFAQEFAGACRHLHSVAGSGCCCGHHAKSSRQVASRLLIEAEQPVDAETAHVRKLRDAGEQAGESDIPASPSENQPHDGGSCVICGWAVSGHFFEFSSPEFDDPLVVALGGMSDPKWSFVCAMTSLARGPPS